MNNIYTRFQQYKNSLNKRILLFFGVLFMLSLAMLTVVGYIVARDALDNKGEIILENAAVQAVALLELQYQRYQSGEISEEEAQEEVKVFLMGEVQEDGTRSMDGKVNLGDLGYFVIYDRMGNEMLHPTLEGQNVWEVTSLKDSDTYIVKNQIELALNGGGYSYYEWMMPDSDKVGDKIAYVKYAPSWQWIVAATAYTSDFNASATTILFTSCIVLLVVFLIGFIAMTRFIVTTTKPIIDVSEGMRGVSLGHYDKVDVINTGDEMQHMVKGYNIMVEDIYRTQMSLNEKNAHLEHMVKHDVLTGLMNRQGLKGRVTAKISEGIEAGSLIQLDLKAFKIINSTFGFEAGDQLLRRIGKALMLHPKVSVDVARTSGSEFMIWLPFANEASIHELTRELRYYLNDDEVLGDITHALELQFAVVRYPNDGHSFEELYKKAAIAMKYAKEAEESGVYFYKHQLSEALYEELSLKKHLTLGLKDKEFLPYYQKKINYKTGDIVGLEALARWESKVLGFVSPGGFIPALSKFHLDLDFSAYMIDRVMSDCRKIWALYGDDVKVSINIATAFFESNRLVDVTRLSMEKYDIPRNRIIYEITEDILIMDFKRFDKISRELKSLGILLSIDDFGTGYSSLSYLRSINADELKIDRSFIDQIQMDDQAFELLKALCNIAEIYGYDLVAEGVETNEQLALLKETPIEVIQGYLFSKPEPLI